jgi:tetratricopeptide (TPR) repeat protein
MFFAGVVSALAGPVDQSFAAMSSVQYWMAGTRYAENRLYIDAVENFTLAIRTNKGEIGIEDMARVFSGRGLAYQHLEEFDKARDDFSNAIELDDRNPEHYLHRGRLFVSQKQYAKARSDFDEAVRLAPGSADGYGGRGLASLEDGDHKQAVADFEKVLSLEPRNPEALYRLGLAYKGSRQDAAALAAFDRLIDAVKKHADAAYHKAGIFARMKKIDSACVWLEIAVQDGFQEWAVLKNDGDFDAIRRNPCYLKIVAGK